MQIQMTITKTARGSFFASCEERDAWHAQGAFGAATDRTARTAWKWAWRLFRQSRHELAAQ